jgi:hypothetical protein
VTTKLAHQTQKTAGIGNGMRTATIAAVTGSAVTIAVAGGQFSSGVGVLTSYAPIVGDTVAVFRQDSSWLILGPTSAVNAWQPMSALGYLNSWANRGAGFPMGQYRVTANGVDMVGQLTNPGIPGAGQVIVTGLPPSPGEIVALGSMGTVRVRLTVDSAGQFRIFDATAAGTLQFLFTYPLDCLLA